MNCTPPSVLFRISVGGFFIEKWLKQVIENVALSVGYPTEVLMEAILKTYDARLDSKKRITIRNPKYDYYHVVKQENGVVILEP